LAATDADVVCVQETRATADQLPPAVRTPAGWHAVFAASAERGRNGVGILTRDLADEVREGFGVAEFDTSGRYLEVALPGLVVGSLYLPSGDVGTARQDEKWRFMAGFLPYLAELRDKAAAAGREVLICGDWNIAHTDLDLKAWRANQRHSGCLPEERAWLSELFDDTGYVDVTRSLHPGVPGPYSWWSYRGKAFDNDAGWRIDLQVATPGLAARAESSVVERAATYAARWSDHAPVTVRYRP
jgi:exodeoxyribonuclease-3